MELGDQSLTVALFDQFPIRRTWHNDEWFYSMNDIIAALVGSPNPQRYWTDLKRDMRAKELFDVYAEGVKKLPMPGADGRMAKTDCGNRETVLRIVQSVKSPNAEPFKRWLAQVGAATLEEEDDIDERALRSDYRLKLHNFETALFELVSYRGVVTAEQRQALRDANYAGLYNVACEQDMIAKRRLPFMSTLEEFMGSTEMAANIFQRAQTADLVQRRNLQGVEEITTVAEDVGVEIRLTIERLGGTMPEDLPRHKRISRGDWMPGLREGDEYVPDAIWSTATPDADDAAIPVIEIEAPKIDE
jgi:DNA-damage-inducible protein D